MAVRKLDRVVWGEFFHRVSRGLLEQRNEIEVLSSRDDRSIEAHWVPAAAMTCDAKAAVLQIALPSFGSITLHPYELYADCSERGLEGLCVFDYEAGWQIILLRRPLDLSPWNGCEAEQDLLASSRVRASAMPKMR